MPIGSIVALSGFNFLLIFGNVGASDFVAPGDSPVGAVSIRDGSGGDGITCVRPQVIINNHPSRSVRATVTDHWQAARGGRGDRRLEFTLAPGATAGVGCIHTGGVGAEPVDHAYSVSAATFLN